MKARVPLVANVFAMALLHAAKHQCARPVSLKNDYKQAYIYRFPMLMNCDLQFAVKIAVLGSHRQCRANLYWSETLHRGGTRRQRVSRAFRDALTQLQPGDPLDENTTLGPLASEGALSFSLEQVREATTHGPQIFMAGDRIHRRDAFIQPTILTNVTADNPAFRKQLFCAGRTLLPCKR